MVRRRLLSVAGVAAALVVGAACKPDFDARPSEIASYRILAIRSEPAEWIRVVDPDTNEAKPAKFTALVADPLGTVLDAGLDWAFCTLPKPLKELNDVAVGCFDDDPRYIQELGKGPATTAAVPENACRQFGPDIPEDQSFRPADPDVTGGYYQPLRVLYRPPADGSVVPAIAKVRIHCGLPGASQEQVAQFNRSYHVNTNPTIDAITANSAPVTPLEDSATAPPLALGPGQSVTLRVGWPACPLVDACGDGVCGPAETKEKGAGECEQDCKVEKTCGGAERYLSFHLDTRALVADRETLRVSWFASSSGGSFRDDRSGRSADDTATFVENLYTAPALPGTYPLWIVLRDDRGGVSWKSLRVEVR